MAPKMPRVQKVVLPILRDALDSRTPAVKVGTWVEDIDYRSFPIINIRRLGGTRYRKGPLALDLPIVEMTAYGDEGLPETEDLYLECLEALYDAVRNQTQTPHGYLHSIEETMGATQFSSPFQDSWRIQGLIKLGVRPPQT